jgi:plasmid maintenance system antidote protein VapI
MRGRRAVSADTAIRLEALTLMEAAFWLRLQSHSPHLSDSDDAKR